MSQNQNLLIKALCLSEDGKTLYVGSEWDVHSYDMEEIRRNIDGLKEKWTKINTEDLTLLRFSLERGSESVYRVFLQKK